ncbi:MAG: hypothetical protein PWP23_2940 [Candidatus Sumerlaeota bacterium]|nr:hypothetical protein [Candidatus Sumerlaeota bacterium]
MSANDREFALLARYLIGSVPPARFRARYESGCRALFGDPAAHSAALRLALRRPALLPLLDAGCALRRREDPLRQRLLLLTAILEASPEYADVFLPRTLTWPKLLLALPLRGVFAAAKALAGAVLLLAVREGAGP